MVTFNPVQRNAFFATKQLLALMNVNIKADRLTDLLVSSHGFPSLAAIVETLETLKIKNLPVSIKEEQLEEIPLPAIAQLTIDGDVFVPIRKIENQNVEWCHEKKGWQNESLTEFVQKWNGIILLVDDSTTFYAQKEFANKSNFITEYASIILGTVTFLCVAYFLGFFDILLSYNWQTLLLFVINIIGFVTLLSVSLWEKIDAKIAVIRQESKFLRDSLIDIERIGFYYFFSIAFSVLICPPTYFPNLSNIFFIFSLSVLGLVFRYFYSTERKLRLFLLGFSLFNLAICYWLSEFSNYENLLNSIVVFSTALIIAYFLFLVFRKFRIAELNNKKLLGITQGFKNNKTLLRDSMDSNKLLPPIFKGMEVIEFGNEESIHTLILGGDPTDTVFVNHFFEIKELVKRNESIKIQIILFPLNFNHIQVSKFIEILLSLPKDSQLSELEIFLHLKGRNFQSWFERHLNIEPTSEAKKIFGMYRSWLDISEKRHFPILALNGIEIPFLYRIDDIEFIIENLEKNHEDTTMKNEYNQLKQKSINKLEKVDCQDIPENTSEIRLFAIMRNESLRLPHFLKYYKELKVDRFFLIDNNSSDNSVDIALSQDNLHLFSTNEAYQNHWYWMEHLLETYGKNHWCVVVDIDELFSFPHAENLNLKDLIHFLEQEGSTSIRTLLLDMYSDSSICSTPYNSGENPLIYTPYFDKDYKSIYFTFSSMYQFKPFTSITFIGGMRDRVFGTISPPHILSKVPLFFNSEDTYLIQGMHAITNSITSNIQGVVFHTKFLSDFITEVKEETERGQHYGGAFYYKHYEKRINEEDAISFYCDDSIKYINSEQLVALDIMKTSDSFEEFARNRKFIEVEYK